MQKGVRNNSLGGRGALGLYLPDAPTNRYSPKGPGPKCEWASAEARKGQRAGQACRLVAAGPCPGSHTTD